MELPTHPAASADAVEATLAIESAATIATSRGTDPSRRATVMLWRRAYAGTPGNARQAREFVEHLLADFAGVDDAVQAAAELTANALAHSRSGAPGGVFVVEVRRWRECAAVTVTDQGGRTAPRLGAPDEDSECGRGLCLVDALALWWGWRGGDFGRMVTAIFHGRS